MHDMNVGIVADWLVTYAGSEKVIKEFIEVYPESDLYSIVDFLSSKDRSLFKCNHKFYSETTCRKVKIPQIFTINAFSH